MKPSFSYRPSYARKPGRWSLLAATLFVVLVVLLDMALGGAIRVYVRSLTAGITQWGSGVGGAISSTGLLSSRRAQERQNQLLTEKVAQCEQRAAGYDALKAENDALRTLVRLAGGAGGGITAPIVSSVRSSPYGTFLVGAGSADGIAKGALVLTSEEFVVGTVSDVGVRTSTVTELFAPGSSIDIVINSATVSAFGYGGGNARTKVPRDLSVAVGDLARSPEFGQRAAGIVGAIASSSADASQDVYIHLPVNLASLRYVYIVPSE